MAEKKKNIPKVEKKVGDEREKALEAAIAQIEKNFGKGAIMRLGEESTKRNVKTIPTGSLSLDIALGAGGIPVGRIIEIYGPESSGKTTVALHMVAEVQKLGGIAGFIDAEHALDPKYAKAIGVDIDNLYISQPDNGEQALEITETMVRSGAMDIIIIDSVAALVPKAEIDGDMADQQMGLQARLMSKGLRKLTGIISKGKDFVIIFLQYDKLVRSGFQRTDRKVNIAAARSFALHRFPCMSFFEFCAVFRRFPSNSCRSGIFFISVIHDR